LALDCGSVVVPARSDEHDAAAAAISHLPHLLAEALAVTAGEVPLAFALAAGSFRDGTRVAGTRPELIAALCDGNRAALARVLDETLAELTRARDALAGDGTVLPLATAGHTARQAWAETTPAVGVTLDRDTPSLRNELLALGAAGGTLDAVTSHQLHARRPDVSGGPGTGRLRP
jgi:prephenate dehydrogenase